jgi:FixJ family two-component response regulator
LSARRDSLPPVLVLAEDEAPLRELLAGLLRRNFPDHDVHPCADGVEADDALSRCIAEGRDVAMVVSDLVMPRMDGLELLEHTAERAPGCARIILTGQGALDSAIQSLRMGVDDFLQKPFTEPELVRTLRRHLETAALRRANAALQDERVFTYRFVARLLDAVLERFDRYLEGVLELPAVTQEQRRGAMRARRALDLVARAFRFGPPREKGQGGNDATVETFALAQTVDSAVRAVLQGRESQGNPFSVHAARAPVILRADEGAVRIALTQLLDNALSTGPGRAVVTILGSGRNWPEGVTEADLPVAVRHALAAGSVAVSVRNTAALTRDDEAWIRRVLEGRPEESDRFRGLGLPLAWLNARILGGDIVFQWRSRLSEVTFTLLLPSGAAGDTESP